MKYVAKIQLNDEVRAIYNEKFGNHFSNKLDFVKREEDC